MKLPYDRVKNIAPLILIWIVLIILFSRTFNNGVPPGIDTLGHLAKVQYLGEHFKETGEIASWMPHWYCGFPVLKYYPPLWYIIAIPIFYTLRDVFLTYNFFVILWAILASSVVFFTVKRKLDFLSALFCAFFFAIAPFTIRELFYIGGIPRLFAILFFPLCFYFTQELFKTTNLRRVIIFLSISFLFYILFHAMTAFFSMTTLMVYIGFKCILEKKVYLKQIGSYLTSVGISVILSAWWLFPAYLERFGTFSSEEAIQTTSIYLKEILGMNFHLFGEIGSRYLGVSILLFALISLYISTNKEKMAIFLTALYCVFFSLGTRTAFYNIPFYSQLFFPERALSDATFLLIFLSSTLFLEIKNIKTKKRYIIGGVLIAICILDFFPSFQLSDRWEEPENVINATKMANMGGRISLISHNAAKAFYPVFLDRKSVEGYYIQGTRHHKELAGINDALQYKWYDYILKRYNKWNVHCVAVSQHNEFSSFLEKNGFSKTSSTDNLDLYCRSTGSYVYPLEKTAIVIGKYSQTVSMVFPEIAEGYSEYLDDYDIDYLKKFDMLILSGFSFHKKENAEAMISELVAEDVKVIIDLQGANVNWQESSPSFLGVNAMSIDVEGTVDLETEELEDFIFEPFYYKGDAWRSVAYLGLENSILNIKKENESYTILGYNVINGKKVYYVGLNLFYHTLLTHDKDAKRVLETIVQPQESHSTKIELRNFAMGNESIEFEYLLGVPTSTVVSVTWSPNWRAYVNGEEIKVQNFENLILLNLPAGDHKVTIEQRRTTLEIFSFVITILAFLFVFILFLTSVYKKS